MQNVFHKLAIAAVLSLGLSLGLMANDDLLAMATNHAPDISSAKMLSQDEMSNVVGGSLIASSVVLARTSGYIQARGTLSEQLYGRTTYIYARTLNGNTQYWINTVNGGKEVYAYSTQSNALINQYSRQIKSYIR